MIFIKTLQKMLKLDSKLDYKLDRQLPKGKKEISN